MKNMIQPLVARDRDEENRSATRLELLFDLVFVIAIAAAARGLETGLVAGNIQETIIKFLMAFFCIWWPWNLYTWFATSFDNGDVAYRIKVMLIMLGAMFIAASMPGFFEEGQLLYTFIGFVIIRMALIGLWWRAGNDNPKFKTTARRFIVGFILVQCFWGGIVFLSVQCSIPLHGLFLLGVLAELFIPWYAEKAENTHWHREHITERFGLFNIIVLGEVLLSAVVSLKTAFSGHLHPSLFMIALCGIITTFLMWWLYFADKNHLDKMEFKRVFIWVYGHALVFASVAAVGAGLGILTEAVGGAADGHAVNFPFAAATFTLPIALYLVGLWWVRDRYVLTARGGWTLLGFALLIALSCLLPYPPVPTTLLLIGCLITRLRNSKDPSDAETT